MKNLTDVTDELMSKTFDIPKRQIEKTNIYKQLSVTGKELVVAKRDEETRLWEVKFYE